MTRNEKETSGAATPEELAEKSIAFSKTAIGYAKKINEELQKIGDDEPG